MRAQNELYFPVAYYYVRSEPCFVHLLFQKKSNDPRDLDVHFSPVIADDYSILNFVPIKNLDDVVFLPEGHSARTILRALNDKCPLAIRFNNKRIVISRDTVDLAEALTTSDKCVARGNPFFGLGLARLVLDHDLEYDAAVCAYEFIKENLPGLEGKWVEQTVISDVTRRKLYNFLKNLKNGESPTDGQTGEKSIFRIVVCALAAAEFVEKRVYERDTVIFRIEFNEMGLEYVEDSEDLIAIVGRPGMFSLPYPLAAHPGKFFFSVAFEGEETVDRDIALPTRDTVWKLASRSEPLDVALDQMLGRAIDFFYPAMWPVVVEATVH